MTKNIFALATFASFFPALVMAHEVYVLPPYIIARDLTLPGLSIPHIISSNSTNFFFWTFISLWTILTVFSISISKPLEMRVMPVLNRLKRYAPLVARLTVGSAIIMSAIQGALFGPELPFTTFISPESIESFRIVLFVLGSLLVVGYLTHLAGALLILIYAFMSLRYGWYMVTYINYFGEMLIVFVVGANTYSLDKFLHHRIYTFMHSMVAWFEHHAFVIFRISFGLSLIYASIYAKYLHAQLAIDTVTMYHLTTYFPFPPEFIVLGAFAIELLLGTFFVFGIEIRFASLFLLFFLTLSLLYFQESVWPHIVLAGGAITIFMRGYDHYTFELGFLRRGKSFTQREPTL